MIKKQGNVAIIVSANSVKKLKVIRKNVFKRPAIIYGGRAYGRICKLLNDYKIV